MLFNVQYLCYQCTYTKRSCLFFFFNPAKTMFDILQADMKLISWEIMKITITSSIKAIAQCQVLRFY